MSDVHSQLVRFCSVWVCLMLQLSGQIFFLKLICVKINHKSLSFSRSLPKSLNPLLNLKLPTISGNRDFSQIIYDQSPIEYGSALG